MVVRSHGRLHDRGLDICVGDWTSKLDPSLHPQNPNLFLVCIQKSFDNEIGPLLEGRIVSKGGNLEAGELSASS